MKMELKKILYKNRKELLSPLNLVLTLFFFGPISVMINNSEKLDYTLGDIWYLFIITSLIFFFSLLLVISFINKFIKLIVKDSFQFVAVFFCALSICFIFQGNWMKYNLGLLDGHEIIWDTFNNQLYFELFVWFLIIGLFLYFRRFIYIHLISILSLLLIFQFSTTVSNVFYNKYSSHSKSLYYKTNNEFKFSSSKNIVLIILDSFRSEAFSQILLRHPEYNEVFKDFIFYQDAIGGYPTTLPSIPLILTGKYYDNSQEITKFIANNRVNAFPLLLKKNGFIIESYSFAPYYGDIYDNISNKIPFSYKKSMLYEQYIITGIRYAPLFFKRFFINQYYEGQNYIHQDIVAFANRTNETKVVDQQPTFKLIHLSGAHPPFHLDTNLNRIDSGYIEQASASLRAVSELITKLKKVGAYDNSLIMIIGDHGSVQPWEYEGTTLTYMAQPLMLAKQINQHLDEIQFSDAKVTISDIPKTIADEIDIKNSYPGYSIFKPIPDSRPRKWFYYAWKESNWFTKYLPELYEFKILGAGNQRSSYKFIKKFSQESENSISIPYYQLGENIIEKYISNEDLRLLLSMNFWYEGDDDYYWSWAANPLACISIPIEKLNTSMSLVISAEPFLVNGQLENQMMNVTVDQIPIITFDKNEKKEVAISSDLAKLITQDDVIDLCFDFPNANKSPNDYGINNDTRLLGYMFTSIIFKEN